MTRKLKACGRFGRRRKAKRNQENQRYQKLQQRLGLRHKNQRDLDLDQQESQEFFIKTYCRGSCEATWYSKLWGRRRGEYWRSRYIHRGIVWKWINGLNLRIG